MALTWQWDDKCGEATFMEEVNGIMREHAVTLYNGNALLIMLNEWVDGGEKFYSLAGFFADKEHMRNCFGLNKKKGYTENIYCKPNSKLVKVKLHKTKCRYLKDITAALVQAFDNISIEIYTD